MALVKCGHPGCSCLPADHENFCSDHCEQVHLIEPKEEHGCLCGHTGCDPRAAHHDTETDFQFEPADMDEPVVQVEPRH